MGYDVVVIVPRIPADDAEAWGDLDALIDHIGPPPEIFRLLYDRLVVRYPCLSSLSDEEIDEGVWSDGPLWNNFGQRAAVLGISYSRVEQVLPFLVESATTLGLAVFDRSTAQIHRPDGLKGLTLTVEDRPALSAPTLNQLHSAVDSLTPTGGPGFLVVERPSGDFAQAAGGNGAYTVEWREYAGELFSHWVAGLAGHPGKNEIVIQANGFQLTVLENERLRVADVQRILAAFAAGGERPTEYAWREITERFA